MQQTLPKYGKKGKLTIGEKGMQRCFMANRCFMCQRNAESHSHLFLHCTVAASLWNMFLSLFGLRWVMPQNFREACESWNLWKVNSSFRKIWKMIPAAISWTIFNERNRRCFDGISTAVKSLKAFCLVHLFSWGHLAPVDSPDSYLNFVSSLALS